MARSACAHVVVQQFQGVAWARTGASRVTLTSTSSSARQRGRTPIQAYRSWRNQHAPDSRFPHGEIPADALRRHANALRRLLARTETVTLVVIHEFALRHIAMAAAAGGSRLPDMAVANAVPYLFDERAAQCAAASLDAMARSGSLGNSLGDTDWPVASDFTVRRRGPAYAGPRLLALHRARRRGAGRPVRGSPQAMNSLTAFLCYRSNR